MKKQYLCLLAVIMTFCGCRKDTPEGSLGDGFCRVSFRGGEQLEVSYGSPTKGSSLLAEGITVRTLAYQRVQGGNVPDPSKDTWCVANSYAAQAGGALHARLVDDKGAVVEGEAPEMELNNGTYDFYGYSPALKLESDNRTVKGIPHYMDFLGAVTPGKAVSRSAAEVALVFGHQCSKVRFNVRTTSDMSNASVSAQKVTLNKMAVSPAEYTLGGALSPTVGTAENVCTLDRLEPASDGKSSSVWQVLLPKGDGTFEGSFYVTVEGKQYVLKAKDIPSMSLLKGTQYIFTATVMQGTVVLTLSVASWKAVSGTVDGGAGSGAGSGSWEEGGGQTGGEAGGNHSLEIGRWEDIDWSGSLGSNPDPVTGAVEIGSWKKADVLVDAGGNHVAGVDQWVTKQLDALAGENNNGNLDHWKDNNAQTGMGVQQPIQANCAMVMPGGWVEFDMADRVTKAKAAPGNSAMTLDWNKGTDYTPLVIWTDVSKIIKSLAYDKATGLVTVTTDGAKGYGNAVIGLFPKGTSDPSGGTCIWSWHVWVTDYQPDAAGYDTRVKNAQIAVPGGRVHTYGAQYMAKNPGKVIMDRNLGATAAYYSPTEAKNAGVNADQAFGMFYQWGRKDPFPRVLGSSIVAADATGTTIPIYGSDGTKLGDEVTDIVGTGYRKVNITVAGLLSGTTKTYAVKNPLAFIYNGPTPYDWYTTTAANQDNSLWGDGTLKSVYDPCPKGWRIAPNGTWSDFTRDATTPANGTFPYYSEGVIGETYAAGNYKATNGRYYSAAGVWYPAPGFRHRETGVLTYVGYEGSVWSSGTDGIYGLYLGFNAQNLYPSYTNFRAHGFQVRCLQE